MAYTTIAPPALRDWGKFSWRTTWAGMPEASRPKKIIDAWCPANEEFVTTRTTNAKI